jgi:hypothetical protein
MAWEGARRPEPAWHRRARRERAGHRLLAQVSAACVKLHLHHGSAIPVVLRPLLAAACWRCPLPQEVPLPRFVSRAAVYDMAIDDTSSEDAAPRPLGADRPLGEGCVVDEVCDDFCAEGLRGALVIGPATAVLHPEPDAVVHPQVQAETVGHAVVAEDVQDLAAGVAGVPAAVDHPQVQVLADCELRLANETKLDAAPVPGLTMPSGFGREADLVRAELLRRREGLRLLADLEARSGSGSTVSTTLVAALSQVCGSWPAGVPLAAANLVLATFAAVPNLPPEVGFIVRPIDIDIDI